MIVPLLVGLCAVVATTLAGSSAAAQRPDLTPEDQARVQAVTAPPTEFSRPQAYESMSGGATTTRRRQDSADAFSQSSSNLDFEGEQRFKLGNALFRKLWVPAPASTQASDGLGPLYNARSCQACHLKDGRGHPPANTDDLATSMVLHLSVPPRRESQRQDLARKSLLAVPEPTYGLQLQDFAAPGLLAEGRMRITYDEVAVTLAGGSSVSLRNPSYEIADLGYGPLDPETMVSPRIAPQMIGLGLLEAIHPEDILSRADPEDADADGISGRPSWIRDGRTGETVLGRFGWKASAPTVRAQSAGAFVTDLGLSNPDWQAHFGDCTTRQRDCYRMPTGVQERLGETEAPDPVLGLVAFYAANLAVPVRRDADDPEVLAGKRIFHDAGCAACHHPSYVTRRDAERSEHRFQLIWPYTDLLLHDMGEGLADHRPAGDASGREWRTPPLWGIGLTERVSGHTFFLHDGRARTLLEAILWHGGEAEAARETVVDMAPEDRAALIRFLESL